jgi:Ricin-type beta-trefoil lectin domain/Glycosyl hydrolases family 18
MGKHEPARARRRRLALSILSTAAMAAALLVAAAPAANAATGTITGYGGKCVDVSGANTANGTKIQLWTCNGTGAQSWTMNTDGTVRALGKCMDVSAAGTADGTRVQLWDCNGTVAQQWVYTAAHDLVNPNANKCLDATGVSSADGTPLQIWSCTGGANQKWNAPGTGGGGGTAAKGAAPYFYLGWGSPPDPRTVMSATGVKWFTMAFMLSNGACSPLWDGWRPLTGGNDQTTINNIRAAGGDVAISFGGASGPWLEQTCTSASALASAYQQVINAYGLQALDIDIEGTVYNNPTSQQRTIDALKIVRANNPGVTIYVTLPSDQSGPDSSMINRAAASGLTVDGWTIMPFDFGGNGQNMGTLSIQAAEGLKNTLKNGYGYTDDQAYRHAGISSMNGITDVGETVTVAHFQTMLAYAQQHHLARFTFWSANRDRPCTGGPADSCSGISQNAWDFTRVIAQYQG